MGIQNALVIGTKKTWNVFLTITHFIRNIFLTTQFYKAVSIAAL